MSLPFCLIFFSQWLATDADAFYTFSVVEFSTPDEAQKAIRDLNDQTLLGRPLFIREVRFVSSALFITLLTALLYRIVRRMLVTELLLSLDVQGMLAPVQRSKEAVADSEEVAEGLEEGLEEGMEEGMLQLPLLPPLPDLVVTCSCKGFVHLFSPFLSIVLPRSFVSSSP